MRFPTGTRAPTQIAQHVLDRHGVKVLTASLPLTVSKEIESPAILADEPASKFLDLGVVRTQSHGVEATERFQVPFLKFLNPESQGVASRAKATRFDGIAIRRTVCALLLAAGLAYRFLLR